MNSDYIKAYIAMNMDSPEILTLKQKLTWDKIMTQSLSVRKGTFVMPEKQFKNQNYTKEQMIEHAYDLLHTPTSHDPIFTNPGQVVYHGGISLPEAEKKDHYVFFTSEDDVGVANLYGAVTQYRITDRVPVYVITYEQLAANYGFDVDLSEFKTVEDFDLYIGDLWDELKEAEYKAHHILSERSMRDNYPLVIGSDEEGNERGFFPSSYYILEQIM